jgi:hypothetical protein
MAKKSRQGCRRYQFAMSRDERRSDADADIFNLAEMGAVVLRPFISRAADSAQAAVAVPRRDYAESGRKGNDDGRQLGVVEVSWRRMTSDSRW